MSSQELTMDEKCKVAAGLIEQSPPGEVNDVINDIRAVVGDDHALMPLVVPALRSYNLAQLHVVEHAAAEGVTAHTSLLSNAAVLPGNEERYVDADAKRSFAFDHVALATSDYEAYNLPEEEEAFRAELAKSLSSYTKNHFSTGYSSVYCSQHPLLPPSPPVPAEEPVARAIPEEPVTDVVPELVGAGEAEPAPTPAVGGGAEEKTEEVVEEGGLEKVDDLVEEAKVEEEKVEAKEAEEGGVESGIEKDGEAVPETKVDEDDTEVDKSEKEVGGDEKPEPVAVPQVEEVVPEPAKEPEVEARKQERVENPIYTLELVGNRYNTSNFWTGRWRTQWTVDHASKQVTGDIKVDVHYFEQGNVQLSAKHSASFPYPSETSSQSIASQIVTTISKIESVYHAELNEVYEELGDKAFRALRRALPVTRQKMEWEKVGGYSLGSDLTKARA
ncbi:hypothetical protein P7C73_g3722, partial [Tremellales sp. Uapishka_1]